MKRFKFTLEALLRLRLRAEEAVKREMAAKNRQIIQAQAQLKDLERQHRELRQEQKARRSRAFCYLCLRNHVVGSAAKLRHDRSNRACINSSSINHR